MIKGTYIVFGERRRPAVITLSEAAFKLFYDRTMLTDRLEVAVEATFGRGFQTALPAWGASIDDQTRAIGPTLVDLAQSFRGPHQDEVRALCAALALKMPFQELAQRIDSRITRKPGSPPTQGASLQSVPPLKPSPAAGVAP